MADAYSLLNMNQEVLKDFELQALRIDDHQTEKIINTTYLRKIVNKWYYYDEGLLIFLIGE